MQEINRLENLFFRLENEKKGVLVSICYRVAGQDSVVVGYLKSASGPSVRLSFQNSYTELSKSNIVDYNVVKFVDVPVCLK